MTVNQSTLITDAGMMADPWPETCPKLPVPIRSAQSQKYGVEEIVRGAFVSAFGFAEMSRLRADGLTAWSRVIVSTAAIAEMSLSGTRTKKAGCKPRNAVAVALEKPSMMVNLLMTRTQPILEEHTISENLGCHHTSPTYPR